MVRLANRTNDDSKKINGKLTADTQPRIGFAYDAVEVCSGKEDLRQVVYKGFSNGKHVINNGESEYYATRTSDTNVEPVFRYDTAHKVI